MKMELFKTKEELELNNKRNAKPFYFINILKFLFLIFLFIYITSLLYNYFDLRSQSKTLWTKQYKLSKSCVEIEESIKLIKTKIEGEQEKVERIKKEHSNTLKRVEETKDIHKTTQESINVYKSKLSEWETKISQKEAILLTVQKDNQLLNQNISDKNRKIDSRILTNNDDILLIEDWAGRKLNSICYSTQFGFVKDLMMKGCQDISPTLVIVKDKDNIIIGGFTTLKWPNDEKKIDYNSFLFSITQRQKYPKRFSGRIISFGDESLSFGDDFTIHRMSILTNSLISSKDRFIEFEIDLYLKKEQLSLRVIEVFSFK